MLDDHKQQKHLRINVQSTQNVAHKENQQNFLLNKKIILTIIIRNQEQSTKMPYELERMHTDMHSLYNNIVVSRNFKNDDYLYESSLFEYLIKVL